MTHGPYPADTPCVAERPKRCLAEHCGASADKALSYGPHLCGSDPWAVIPWSGVECGLKAVPCRQWLMSSASVVCRLLKGATESGAARGHTRCLMGRALAGSGGSWSRFNGDLKWLGDHCGASAGEEVTHGPYPLVCDSWVRSVEWSVVKRSPAGLAFGSETCRNSAALPAAQPGGHGVLGFTLARERSRM